MNLRTFTKDTWAIGLLVLMAAIVFMSNACSPVGKAVDLSARDLSSRGGLVNAPPPNTTITIIESEDDPEFGLEFRTAVSLGYRSIPGVVCTQIAGILLHPDRNLCVMASDGCIIGFLQNLGFRADSTRACDEATF